MPHGNKMKKKTIKKKTQPGICRSSRAKLLMAQMVRGERQRERIGYRSNKRRSVTPLFLGPH